MEPKITPGGLKTLKNGRITFIEAPRPEPANFCSPPEGSKSAPGAIYIALTWPPGSHLGPGGSPEASGSSF